MSILPRHVLKKLDVDRQTTNRRAPAVQSHFLAHEHYKNQSTSERRQASGHQQEDTRDTSSRHDSWQLCSGQQDTRTDSQQRDDEYAIQQYQRLLLREQAKRNREMARQ